MFQIKSNIVAFRAFTASGEEVGRYDTVIIEQVWLRERNAITQAVKSLRLDSHQLTVVC